MSVCLSVCLSICPSHAGIVSKRLHISSNFVHHRIAPSFYSVPNGMTIFRRGPPNGGVECMGVWKNHDFRPMSLYLRTDARYSHSYYASWSSIEEYSNRTQAFEWYQFEWSWVTSDPDIIQRQITQKQYNIYNGGIIESRIWYMKQRHFQWPWTTPNPVFKVTLYFDAEYLVNG